MAKFEVNIDRGIEIDGAHHALGTVVALDEADAAPFVTKGWLVEVSEPGEETVPFVREDDKE